MKKSILLGFLIAITGAVGYLVYSSEAGQSDSDISIYISDFRDCDTTGG